MPFPAGPDPHHHGLEQCSAAVVHGRIGDVGAKQLADDRLKLEDRLEGPLGELGLVGGIRGVELTARAQRVYRFRNKVVVETGADKVYQMGVELMLLILQMLLVKGLLLQ